MTTIESEYAPPSERDRFLRALDGEDRALTAQLAVQLTGCSNPLPSSTCVALGLPVGSSYGMAARKLIGENDGAKTMGAPAGT